MIMKDEGIQQSKRALRNIRINQSIKWYQLLLFNDKIVFVKKGIVWSNFVIVPDDTAVSWPVTAAHNFYRIAETEICMQNSMVYTIIGVVGWLLLFMLIIIALLVCHVRRLRKCRTDDDKDGQLSYVSGSGSGSLGAASVSSTSQLLRFRWVSRLVWFLQPLFFLVKALCFSRACHDITASSMARRSG